jgi:hypothetical protein
MIVRSVNASLSTVVLPFLLVRKLPDTKFNSWVLMVSIAGWFQVFETGISSGVVRFVGASGDSDEEIEVVSSAQGLLKVPVIAAGLVTLGFICFWINIFSPQLNSVEVRFSFAFITFGALISAIFSPAIGFWTATLNGKILAKTSFLIRFGQLIFCVLASILTNSLVFVACAYSFPAIAGSCHLYLKVMRLRDKEAAVQTRGDNRERLKVHTKAALFWVLPGLFVSGFDAVLVARFEPALTGTYSLALSVSSLIAVIHAAALGPIVSKLASLDATPGEIGEWVVRSGAKINAVFALLSSLAILSTLFSGYVIPVAKNTSKFQVLTILIVIGNFIRMIGSPYSASLMATGGHRKVRATPIAEATVNFAVSILLGIRFGALGVAIGTIAGSCVSLLLHFTLNMKRVREVSLSRNQFAKISIIPQACVVGGAVLSFIALKY